MFQVAKWDIVRSKEKEMLANLHRLKVKQRKMVKWITHVVLLQIMHKFHKKFETLKEIQRIKEKRLWGAFIMQMFFITAMKKRGQDIQTRMRQRIHHTLSFMLVPSVQGAELKAKNSICWFMKESAERHEKLTIFKVMMSHVIRVQRGYKKMKLRRIVKRTLMDVVWENFITEQNNLT